MARALVHPQLPRAIDHRGQTKTQLTPGIGVAHSHGLTGRGHQGHGRTSGRDTRAELTLELKGAVQVGDPLKTRFKSVGQGRGCRQTNRH